MRQVAIIDYGVGNLLSLKMSIEFLGAKAIITNDEKSVLSCSHIILPGVGAFSRAMDLIKNLHLDKILLNAKNNGSKILGICLGMQLLMNESEEFGINEGLKFIDGKVISIKNDKSIHEDIKIPNIGWFNLEKKNVKNHQLLNCINKEDTFYFVHSFKVEPDQKEVCVFNINYNGAQIPAVIMKDNILGVQFHPEKSGASGLKLLKNFMEL